MTAATKNSGLLHTTSTAIRGVFAKHQNVEKAILYGSRALGSYRAGSDIDLTLLGNINYQELQQLELELDDLLLPYKFDLSRFTDLDNPELVKHIERAGITFYTAK